MNIATNFIIFFTRLFSYLYKAMLLLSLSSGVLFTNSSAIGLSYVQNKVFSYHTDSPTIEKVNYSDINKANVLDIEHDVPILPLSQENYSYFAKNQSLTSLLEDLAEMSGQKIKISNKVRGQVNAYFHDVTPSSLFLNLIKSNNLVWYYDGIILYVYDSSEITQKFIQLYNIDASKLKSKLIEMNAYDPRFAWKEVGDNLLTIFGPPQYLEIIDELLNIVDSQNEIGVRIFPLKYAYAYDRQVSIGSSINKVEGVASILKRILTNSSDWEKYANNPKIIKEFVNNTSDSSNISPLLAINRKRNPQVLSQQSDFTPQISADNRSNGIIVYDYVKKFPAYQKLIDSLDIEMPLIEIAVTIIDIATSNELAAGIDWYLNFMNKVKLNNLGNIDVNLSNSDLGGVSALTSGFVTNNLKLPDIISQVKLMEHRGEGKIISRPTILTSNNLKAILDHSRTFYVRGTIESLHNDINDETNNNSLRSRRGNITPVNVGLNLQVTPHIIEAENGKLIQMNIDIRDGSIIENSSMNVDNIPLTNQTQITSQATIEEGNSIILGGYYHEQQSSQVKRVPILGYIPVVGFFFSKREHNVRKMERVFIITPRIIKSQDKYDITQLKKLSDISATQSYSRLFNHAAKPLSSSTKLKPNSKLNHNESKLLQDPILQEILEHVPLHLKLNMPLIVLRTYHKCRRFNSIESCLQKVTKKFKLDNIITPLLPKD